MKKGFTLIELLAVIIILAVIALIATPVVLDVVDTAKEKALVNSAYGIVDAAKLKFTESMFNNSAVQSGNAADLEVSGEKATDGTWEVKNGKIVITGVKFASDTTRTCSNTEADATVTCTK